MWWWISIYDGHFANEKTGFKNLLNIYGGFGAMQAAGMEIVTEEIAIAKLSD
ncbi:MAG: hypothetical protein JJE09_15225 [Bacteroidia bacterium]|nr:hypothetical protein [Bacteroidia bacterium]